MRAAVAVLLALLVGCAGDDATSGAPRQDSTPGPTTTSATPSPTAPTESTTTPPPSRDRSLDAPLIRAAGRGSTKRVADLLARGASVRARDDQRRTALIRAAYGNHVATAEVLVAAGADVNAKDRTVQSAYLIATSEVGDDTRLLDLVLANGADVRSLDSFDGTGLIRAADRGFVRVVRRLLETDIEVDHVNNLGWTALHEAVILGDGSRDYVRVVRLLADAGADVNKPSRRDGLRPLQHAEQRGFTAVAQALREAGAR